MHPFLVFDDVSFRYPSANGEASAPLPAIDHISLKIEQGEFVACIGGNGSGKSTFARLANALLFPQSGAVRVNGLDTGQPENRMRIHANVGMVFQFPEDQIVSTSVEEDVAFGPENLALPPDEIHQRVEAALQEVGLWEVRQRPPHMLSAGQVQRLALAGVLAMNPRCIVFDEATTMLDPSGRKTLMAAMRRLHEQGTTIIFITHFMEEAAQADRLIVFQSGKIALDGAPEQVFSDPERLKELGLDLPPAAWIARALHVMMPSIEQDIYILPALLAGLPAYTGHQRVNAGKNSAKASVRFEQALEIDVEGLGYVYMRGTPVEQKALSGVSLRVTPGEAHGLAGMTGSGKSTLMQHINGLLRVQEGRIRVAGFNLGDPRLDRRNVVRQVGLVFQNPEAQFFEYYVGDEISFGPRQLKVGEPGNPLLADRVRQAMEKVGLDFQTFKDRPLSGLSGGERRKVALASTLALQPSVLLLDEPTAGLDPHSRRELLARLQEMRASGITILLSSHQMEDIALLAQSITVMHKGQVVLDGPTKEVFSDANRLAEYGLELPAAVQVAQALRELGWPIPLDVLTVDQLINWAGAALQEGA